MTRYRVWTDEEKRKALHLDADGLGTDDICAALGRTRGDVRDTLRLLKLQASGSAPPDDLPVIAEFSDQEIAVVRRMRNLNFHAGEIAQELPGRTSAEVRLLLAQGLPPASVPAAKAARIVNNAKSAVSVPLRVLTDRRMRAAAEHRDLTAALMGDPPVGYSALDRRPA